MHRQIVALCGSAVALMFVAGVAFAQEQEFKLVIQDHKFSPAELTVPADKKIKLVIENRDATPEEFESKELKREKVIPGRSTGTVTVGPLKPGRYPFFGEFNPKTAQGALIVQ